MSVSVVNGYICYSSCDAAKAHAGKDPHPKPDGSLQADGTNGTPGRDSPAVIYGGALAGLNETTPADGGPAAYGLSGNSAPAAANPASPPTGVDMLV